MSGSDVRALSSKSAVTPPTGEVHPGLPPGLSALLAARDEDARHVAWERFVAAHTALLLHTCRTLARDRDAAMDGYAFILDALREDHCHRLRAYVPDPRTRFTTWLVVVARRLLLDHHRQRYGRPRSQDEGHRAEHAARRRLEDLVGLELDPEGATASTPAPDAGLLRNEVQAALASAMATLTPAERLILALRFEDDRPVREIARVMGEPTVFHVYRRISGVLAKLRSRLAERGVDAAEP
jgi:RNA polymerase sigma factor (sigma-70 family)